ncbi:hypothetical protein HOP50_03g23270 [Chloropicon primus]|uniref:Uncharacterized protein n=2 Tax=Chloropicon primus TaxID=1764295 RepID=A0A5B8MHQ5_9CHLO|nr:hypothetical protein A3770_03p23290 [Chloropicon primus]UPQ99021.1 hypothetical protein HOP50_03g23270 [Chloropicon primus]|eukprot:QDZ19811.1 hypothetical protein A3770_03p23290 [Chloropicon primus]
MKGRLAQRSQHTSGRMVEGCTSGRALAAGRRGVRCCGGVSLERRRRVVACAASGGKRSSGDEWKQKYDKALNEDLPKFWKEFRKQATLRAEILADDSRRALQKMDRKFKISNKADKVRNEVSLKFESFDNKFGVKTKLENAAEDFKRNYPELKRKFTAFSKTTTGQVVLYGAFIYLIFSGIYLKVLYFMFLLSLFSPLFLPALQKFILEQQQAEQERNANAYSTQNSWFDRFTQQGSAGRPGAKRQQKPRGQDDIVIDAEWTSIADDDE